MKLANKDAEQRYKVKKRIIGLILCSLLCMFGITGCFPKAYTRKEAKEQIAIGEELFKEYLEEHYERAKIREINVHDYLYENSEWRLTDYVKGSFIYDEKYYLFAVNTENGNIYTSVEYDDFVTACQEIVVDMLDLEYDSIQCTYFSFDLAVEAISTDTENILYGESTELRALLPVNVDITEFAKEQLQNGNKGIHMELSFYGGKTIAEHNFEINDMQELPGILLLELKNIRESIYLDEFQKEYYFYVETEELKKINKKYKQKDNRRIDNIKDYMCSETMELGSSLEYREWSEYEKDGFFIYYSNYYKDITEEMDEETREYTGTYLLTEEYCKPDETFHVNVETDYLEVSFPEESNMQYYIYIKDFERVDSINNVVYYNERMAESARYQGKEWYEECDIYLIADGLVEDWDCYDKGQLYYGKQAKKMRNKVND